VPSTSARRSLIKGLKALHFGSYCFNNASFFV
jgi:hypothetical protein